MRNFFILIIPILFVSIFADDIDTMVKKINSKRDSNISKEELSLIPSPMVQKSSDKNVTNSVKPLPVKVIVEENIVLQGIMNNSAYINGKWVKMGEKINNYTLVDVMDDSVYLKDGNRSKLIFFKQNNGKIKIRLGR